MIRLPRSRHQTRTFEYHAGFRADSPEEEMRLFREKLLQDARTGEAKARGARWALRMLNEGQYER